MCGPSPTSKELSWRPFSTIHQRELHSDTPSFAHALRSAMRQAPKVILVGDMRDRETIEIVLEAAETGHLVFSSLNTMDAAKTVERIVSSFSPTEQQSVRERFAKSFRYIICQRLMSKSDRSGRVAAFEILKANARTRECIEKGRAREQKSSRRHQGRRRRRYAAFRRRNCTTGAGSRGRSRNRALLCQQSGRSRPGIGAVDPPPTAPRYFFPASECGSSLPFSAGHLCSANWVLRLCCASATRFKEDIETLNSRLQPVQTPTAGTMPSHFATRRLRFAMPTVSRRSTPDCSRFLSFAVVSSLHVRRAREFNVS